MKLVILDRDGTINHDSVQYIKSPKEWIPLPKALEAIAKLNHAGWCTVVVSNQSGVARGLLDVMILNTIHAKMHKMLAEVGGRIDAVVFCPHHPDEHCRCRKPLPTMIELILERYGLPACQVPVVGDSPSDLQAAVAAGCPPHAVLTGKQGLAVERSGFPESTIVHSDLMSFANYLIAHEEG